MAHRVQLYLLAAIFALTRIITLTGRLLLAFVLTAQWILILGSGCGGGPGGRLFYGPQDCFLGPWNGLVLVRVLVPGGR